MEVIGNELFVGSHALLTLPLDSSGGMSKPRILIFWILITDVSRVVSGRIHY